MAEIKKIDHIGIVVPDMEKAIDIYKSMLLMEPSHLEHVAASKVDLAFFDVGDVQVELLAPTAPDSEMSPFLEETGGGIHHICYEVVGIRDILKQLKEEGFKLIDEEPRPGSRNSQIAFVDASSTDGAYIEYCEFPA
jgi:methylmalonyl-CoA/ethylmalonyl-CoA epimerase